MKINLAVFCIGVLISLPAWCTTLAGDIQIFCDANNGKILFLFKKSDKGDSVKSIGVTRQANKKVIWEIQNPVQRDIGNKVMVSYRAKPIPPNGFVKVAPRKLIPGEWYETIYSGYGIRGRQIFKFERPNDNSCLVELVH